MSAIPLNRLSQSTRDDNGHSHVFRSDSSTASDLFFAASDFHLEVAERARTVSFGERHIRVLSPEDLAVFKAMFDRPKDWVDIDEMAASNALDRAVASRRLAIMLGPDDPRVARLASS